jgi:hypothetical protein
MVTLMSYAISQFNIESRRLDFTTAFLTLSHFSSFAQPYSSPTLTLLAVVTHKHTQFIMFGMGGGRKKTVATTAKATSVSRIIITTCLLKATLFLFLAVLVVVVLGKNV